ncbi:hypothetical protein ABK040_006362 [Willaertia magna]
MSNKQKLRKAFTEDEIKQLKEIFDLVDTDGGGSIQRDELRTLMYTIGLNPTEEQLDAMMLEVDFDHSGDIDFEEFTTVMSKEVEAAYTKEELIKAFKFLETKESGKGYVKVDVLEKALLTYGDNVNSDKARELLSSLTRDENNKINYIEYINMMMQE